MKHVVRPCLCLALLITLVGSARTLAQFDPLIGTWKFEPARSQFSPGPPPASESVTYETAGGGLKYTVIQTDTAGASARLEGTITYDGKDYPATGTADYDMVATRRIDTHTGETVRKKNGKAVQTVTRVVSRDGKTLTLTTKGVTANGVSINNVAVYARQ